MSLEELPKNWGKTNLENLFGFVIGGDWGKDPDYSDPDFVDAICIRGSEFKKWDLNRGSTALPRKIKSSSLLVRRLKKGDILVEISGGGPDQPVGRTVVIDDAVFSQQENKNLICTNFIRLARPIESVNPVFLNFFLKKFYQSGEVISYQGGSNNLRNLKFNDYLTIDVPLPPLTEQHQIAEKLDELLTQVERLKARLDAIPSILKRFRQSVLAAAVSGKLTEDWRGSADKLWMISTIGDLFKCIDGDRGSNYPKKDEYFSHGYCLFLSTRNVRQFGFDFSYKVFLTKEKHDSLRSGTLLRGDLIITTRGTLGYIASYDDSVPYNVVRINSGMLILRKKNSDLLNDFFKILIASPVFQKTIDEQRTGSAQPQLPAKILKNFAFEIPPLEEQTEIVRRVEQLFAYADQIEQRVKDAQTRVNSLTQSILAKAFRGELTAEWREQNPDLISGENSAQALLDRIKAERAAQANAKKPRGKAKAQTS